MDPLTGNTSVCDWKDLSLSMLYRGNISSKLSCISEANAPELSNLEEMFPCYKY